MIYFSYGRKKVDGEWCGPEGFLPAESTCDIFYQANYFGSLSSGSLDIVSDFDPTEVSKSVYDVAFAAQPTTGSA
jgi:hypothetical protein